MKINIKDAADLLSLTEDELLMQSQSSDIISAHFVPPTDMIYNDDGTVQFVDGDENSTWEFEMEEVIAYKKHIEQEDGYE